ncbi:MAG TPA: phosphomannomutase/phosphoglucomutase [Smithellaceae bacterium]|jgi:phosphomannomutase/phosphoglucomutase|nr:phosphomannomutase/phosphoglucomutase [Syntrophaceae bacterium]HPV49508.1 phosphomannomutase/phosphoglucomutase [Smithellaceae bacterium]
MNPHVFREYDVRGIVDRDLNEIFVVNLGRAIGTYALANNVKTMTIGRDCRLSSDAYQKYLIQGLNAAGIDTIDIGLCATPMLYYSIRHLDTGGGVMVTGSHNPPEFNGFKICVGYDSIHGQEIQQLRKIMESGAYVSGKGSGRSQDITESYQNYILDHIHINKKLKVAIDGGNGVGGKFATPILEKLGCELHCIYCEPDGTFPNHFPDPTVEEHLQDLITLVANKKADLGIAFDGDADRLGVVSNTGEIIWGDKLLLLFARDILKDNPGATIIGEVKCSQVLYDGIRQHSGNPVMWKAGHSLIKAKMKQEKALLGGEMSGHLFFADRYFGYDDAIYAAARLLEILSRTDKSISELFADIPRTFSTPEIRIDCPDDQKARIVEKIKNHYRNTPGVIDIDGVRVPFEDGWALVRCSNTQPVIVLRFEASSPESLNKIKAEVEALLA